MKTYLVTIIALALTACTGVTQSAVNYHLDRQERLDRIESKAEARVKE